MTDQPEVAAYDAYLLRYPDGTWLAQLTDLPGAYATGASQEEATARLAAAIPVYFAWLSQHDEYTPITHSEARVVVREVAQAPSGAIQAPTVFFSGDAEPVSEEDLDWWLATLDWAYGDLVELAQRASGVQPGALLGAVARVQMDVVRRATGGMVGQIVAPGTTPDPRMMLHLARQTARSVFRRTTAEQRIAVREEDGERWSLRRGLRESALLARRATDDLAAMQARQV